MENNQKPEWFELADNDRAVNRPSKKKSGPIRSLTFIVAGILVVPMGAGVVLLAHEGQRVSTAETLNFIQDSPAATSSVQTQQSSAITMPTVSREDDEDEGDDDRAPVFANSVNTSPTPSVQTAPTAVTNVPVVKTTAAMPPSAAKAPAAITPPGSSSTPDDIILPPTKKAGDDDDDDEDEDDDDDEEDDD
jgi:cytoskeletal protein RodZ